MRKMWGINFCWQDFKKSIVSESRILNGDTFGHRRED
jgi:hypothetical protein